MESLLVMKSWAASRGWLGGEHRRVLWSPDTCPSRHREADMSILGTAPTPAPCPLGFPVVFAFSRSFHWLPGEVYCGWWGGWSPFNTILCSCLSLVGAGWLRVMTTPSPWISDVLLRLDIAGWTPCVLCVPSWNLFLLFHYLSVWIYNYSLDYFLIFWSPVSTLVTTVHQPIYPSCVP